MLGLEGGARLLLQSVTCGDLALPCPAVTIESSGCCLYGGMIFSSRNVYTQVPRSGDDSSACFGVGIVFSGPFWGSMADPLTRFPCPSLLF